MVKKKTSSKTTSSKGSNTPQTPNPSGKFMLPDLKLAQIQFALDTVPHSILGLLSILYGMCLRAQISSAASSIVSNKTEHQKLSSNRYNASNLISGNPFSGSFLSALAFQPTYKTDNAEIAAMENPDAEYETRLEEIRSYKFSAQDTSEPTHTPTNILNTRAREYHRIKGKFQSTPIYSPGDFLLGIAPANLTPEIFWELFNGLLKTAGFSDGINMLKSSVIDVVPAPLPKASDPPHEWVISFISYIMSYEGKNLVFYDEIDLTKEPDNKLPLEVPLPFTRPSSIPKRSEINIPAAGRYSDALKRLEGESPQNPSKP